MYQCLTFKNMELQVECGSSKAYTFISNLPLSRQFWLYILFLQMFQITQGVGTVFALYNHLSDIGIKNRKKIPLILALIFKSFPVLFFAFLGSIFLCAILWAPLTPWKPLSLNPNYLGFGNGGRVQQPLWAACPYPLPPYFTASLYCFA